MNINVIPKYTNNLKFLSNTKNANKPINDAPIAVRTPIKETVVNISTEKRAKKSFPYHNFDLRKKYKNNIKENDKNKPFVIGCVNTPLIRPNRRPPPSANAYALLNSAPLKGIISIR